MNSFAYDFHIHSCLSPCGDDDMTPANIVGMAALKGLQAIAITDHNTCKHCEVAMRHGEANGITVIPGMELTTREEVHVLCLFELLNNAMAFDDYVYNKLIKIKNKAEIFGRQIIVDEEDCEIAEEENLLIQATDISFDEVYSLMITYGGIMIPAHIDKSSNSLLSNLGFIPPDSNFTCVEMKDISKKEDLMIKHPYLQLCKCISNSDAHSLGYINEPIHFIHARSNNRADIINALKEKLGISSSI